MMEAETENNSQRVMIDVRIVMRNSTAMEATVSLMIALMIHGVCLKKKNYCYFFLGLMEATTIENLFLLLSTPETSPAPL